MLTIICMSNDTRNQSATFSYISNPLHPPAYDDYLEFLQNQHSYVRAACRYCCSIFIGQKASKLASYSCLGLFFPWVTLENMNKSTSRFGTKVWNVNERRSWKMTPSSVQSSQLFYDLIDLPTWGLSRRRRPKRISHVFQAKKKRPARAELL